ncbi:MAG: SRPBCC family protein [Armatimonadetes bacterium]|nr:SRPBCC family protein [Armatimonadota bacterium]
MTLSSLKPELRFDETVFPRQGRERPAVRLSASVWLPLPPDELFPFFSDAANLQTLTPPWLDFRILTPLPIEMRPGALIRYRIRVRGLSFGWLTEISEWDPRRGFVDQQLRGPYALWHHRHGFQPLDGGTLATDVVHYWPKGGRLADRLFVRRDVARIFAYRSEKLLELFGR